MPAYVEIVNGNELMISDFGADEFSYDQEVWKLRVTKSVEDIEQHIHINIKWIHPCRYASFYGATILSDALEVIAGERKTVTISPFEYESPQDFQLYECG